MAIPVPTRQLFIDGEWRVPINKNRIPIINPATEETIGLYFQSSLFISRCNAVIMSNCCARACISLFLGVGVCVGVGQVQQKSQMTKLFNELLENLFVV